MSFYDMIDDLDVFNENFKADDLGYKECFTFTEPEIALSSNRLSVLIQKEVDYEKMLKEL